MRRLFKFRYTKITALVLSVIVAYIIFSNESVQSLIPELNGLGYVGMFVAGIVFSFGFTAPIASGFFIVLNPENPILYSIIGGLGSIVGDLFIFNIIKISFMDEFKRLENTKLLREINKISKWHYLKKVRVYLMYSIVGFLLASPLPDEAGIILLAGLTKIKQFNLAVISFILHAIGIWVLFLI